MAIAGNYISKNGAHIMVDDSTPDNSPENNRLSIKKVAELMGASEWFIRRGLQQGLFPWGYAVKTSSKYTYWISAIKFTEYTGIKVTE